ncbi:MAG TPA: hypothetical protein VNT99_07250 [Methylomirabilota bacterium]|nr:hypothetical protein [Methylomirabilota bacterium]
MKFSRSTLALIALNVAWLAALSHFLARRAATADSETPVQFVTNYVPVFKSARPAVVTNVVAATNDFRWAQLEAEDYRDYVARLRSIGCPEQTIRDIIIADVDKLLAPKLQAAGGRTNAIMYWQPIEQELWEDAEQKEALRQQRQVDFEKREVIRQLLGVDLVGERLRVQGQGDYYGDRLGFLSEEKRARVRTALDQFADEERSLLEQQAEEGNALAGSPELTRVRQQKEAALAELLTPDERKQYDLWFSPAAAMVRESVFGMKASEDEFLKLYELRQNFAAKSGEGFGPGDPSWNDYQAQVRQALGDQRYAEYARAQDSDYRELMRVTTRFKLGPEVAAQLYSYKQPVEEERTRVETDPTLTPEQKQVAFEAIADETQRAFKQALGEKAFRHFMMRSANPWLQRTRAGAARSVAVDP